MKASSAGEQLKAQSWLDDALLPPGAVRSESATATTGGWGTETYRWWCSPTETIEAYWTVPGTTVNAAATWMSTNPGPDFIVPVPFKVFPEGSEVAVAALSNIASLDSLEGIICTISKTDDGVAIRAIIGVIPETATCPSPSTGLGAPGMG